MSITAVGFDLDETLVVPDRDRAELLSEATEAVGAPRIDRHEYLDAHRRNLTTESRTPIFSELLEDSPREIKPGDLAAAYRRRVTNALRPINGADSLIDSLQAEYAVGLLTNGPSRAQRDKLAALAWEHRFDAVVISGDIDAGKPDPVAFDELARALDCPNHKIAYVGDNPTTDITGAATAGLRPIQVLYPDGPPPDPRAAAHIERAELPTRLSALLATLSPGC